MGSNKLDAMREKLKLDSMDEYKKKELFNKFVSVGGKVVNIDQDKEVKTRRGRHAASSVQPVSVPNENKPSQQGARSGETMVKGIDLSPAARKDNPINRWIERVSVKLACVFSGVLAFSDDFTNFFKDLLLVEYQNTLLDCRMILASILYQDRFSANEIKKVLISDQVTPHYYELIFRFDNLSDDDLFVRLQIIKTSLKGDEEVRAILKEIFKPLFILHPYFYSLKTGIEKALLYERELNKLDSNITYANIRKLNSSIDFIFGKIFPRLFNLIEYFFRCDPDYKKITFKDYLGIEESDSIGFLTNLWKAEIALSIRKETDGKNKGKQAKNDAVTDENNEENQGNNQLENADEKDPVKKGLIIINEAVKFREILDAYTSAKDPRALFSIKDKVFLTYTLIDFYDKEFSFIFNSNKAEFNIVFIEGKRVDLKRELSDIYYRISSLYERVTEYLKIVREVRKIESDTFINAQERSARSNQYSLQRSQISRVIRKDAKEFFEAFSKKLILILSDQNRENMILANPEAVLEFDKKLNGGRFVEGKKVIQSIEEAYCFSSIMQFLLGDGDLGGYSLSLEKPIYLNLES